jgi:hypothetical protein
MENEEIVRNADISENFTIIGNNIIKDERLSIEARFVLIFMRSFKKGWVFYKKDLQERLNVGRRVLDRCFEELAEVGYLIETEMLEKQGMFISKGYVVYPYSIKDDPITLYSTDVQNVQRKEEPSITKETADVQNVQRGVLSDVQNVHLINTNINTYNTAPTLNSSSPKNKVTDNPDEMKKGGGGAAGFVKPSIDEVHAYAKVKHEMTDMAAKQFAEEFWNFYESKGWLVGKSKMKSWQSAVSGTWKEKAIKLKGGSGIISSTTSNIKFNRL